MPPCSVPRKALWVIVPALWGAPALFFVTASVWIGPLCLLALLLAVALIKSVDRSFATFSAQSSTTASHLMAPVLHAGILLGLYLLTFVWFYASTDTWEIWTWLMHSSTQYGDSLQTGQEIEPTLYEVLHHPRVGRWRGPHITHGLLHSTPMVTALKFFVREDTRRFPVNQVMRGVNMVCALTGIPLFFLAFRKIRLLRHADVAAIAALTSPGIFIVSGKGHWLGISYGLACLTFFVGITFFASGKWRYLIGFLIAWGLLLASYTSAQFFFIICGGFTIGYLLFSRRVTIPAWRIVILISVAALVFYLLIGRPNPTNMLRHFQGNGESWFEIRDNQIELNRFAGYWQKDASRYGLESTLTWPVFYRAGLGMIARNIRTVLKNFLGTGRFYQLWLTPHHGNIKSFGFVLPWFFVIGTFWLMLQRRWQEWVWQGLVFCGPVVMIGLLLLMTWDMSVHRVFSINLLLAGFAGTLYDQVFAHCRLLRHMPFKYPLFMALYGQLVVVLLLEKAALGM